MFGDVRALQELKNFDSQFIAGVKGVAPCTFIDKGELSEPAPYTPVPCAPPNSKASMVAKRRTNYCSVSHGRR